MASVEYTPTGQRSGFVGKVSHANRVAAARAYITASTKTGKNVPEHIRRLANERP